MSKPDNQPDNDAGDMRPSPVSVAMRIVNGMKRPLWHLVHRAARSRDVSLLRYAAHHIKTVAPLHPVPIDQVSTRHLREHVVRHAISDRYRTQ